MLRARLDGGIRSKAARGHLRRGLPVGLVWGEADGQIGFHPDEAVTGVIGAVFEQFAVCGSVRGVWLWLRDQGLRWPLQGAYRRGQDAEITWVAPTYHAVHTTLTNPAYAGAYTYGRTRSERYLDSRGVLRSRRREMPRDQWEVLITGHYEGWVTWHTYLANQQRIAGNTRPQGRRPGTGAVREGSAQLQGLASCGICGRRLAVFYDMVAHHARRLVLAYRCSSQTRRTSDTPQGKGDAGGPQMVNQFRDLGGNLVRLRCTSPGHHRRAGRPGGAGSDPRGCRGSRAGRAGSGRAAGVPVAAPVGGPAVGPGGFQPPPAPQAAQEPGQQVSARSRAAGRADVLGRDVIGLADQRGMGGAAEMIQPAAGPPLQVLLLIELPTE